MFVYTHTQNPQALRSGHCAHALALQWSNVVVATFAGPGHYGRSNGGNAGAEDEAVILSQAVGKPVRVQWMRAGRSSVVDAIFRSLFRCPAWP